MEDFIYKWTLLIRGVLLWNRHIDSSRIDWSIHPKCICRWFCTCAAQITTWISNFKPKRQNPIKSISSKLQIRSSRNLKATLEYTIHFMGGLITQYPRGCRPPSEKAIWRHNFVVRKSRCKMTCQWQQLGWNRNRKQNSNMAAVCVQKPEVVISQPRIDISSNSVCF